MQEFINADLCLPVHNIELHKAETAISKLRIKFEIHQTNKTLTDNQHTALYEEIVRVLNFVGQLSEPAFKIEDKLGDLYTLQYPHSPELAKKLWLDHYESIHHPYNILKNRCFKLLEELDDLYIAMYKKNPPNWNI